MKEKGRERVSEGVSPTHGQGVPGNGVSDSSEYPVQLPQRSAAIVQSPGHPGGGGEGGEGRGGRREGRSDVELVSGEKGRERGREKERERESERESGEEGGRGTDPTLLTCQ